MKPDSTGNIRAYTPADKENVMALLRLNTPAYFSPDEEKDLDEYLEHRIDYYYVVEANGAIVGCGGINLPEEKLAVLSWDLFHPQSHGKGFGSLLTRFRIERIKEMKDISMIRVRTTQLVYPFYQKFGFGLKEVVKDYWAEGFDLYRMEMRAS